MANQAGGSTSLLELIQLLIELASDRAWGNVSFALSDGQIGIVKIERHYKPGTLPIRDRERLAELQIAGSRLAAPARAD